MQRQTAIKTLKVLVYSGIYGGLLMPLVFLPVVIFPFVFSKLIFFQILIGLTFPAYLALAWMEPQYRPRKSWLYGAILAYFGALLLSVIFAVDPAKAWWGNQERMNGLFTLLHFLAWLTMAVSVIRTWPQWKNLLNYQIVLGFFMACVALLQKPFPNLLMFPAGPRVGGLLDNPIYMGTYQLFIMFFIALLWFKTKSNGWRVWYVFAMLASVTSMFAAGSRGPFMGLIFGIVISAAAVGIMHKNKKIRWGIVASIAAAAVIYLSIVTLGVKTEAFKKFTADFPTASRIFVLQTGTAGRFIAWNIAWQGFMERPLTGWGLDDFHILFNQHYNPQSLRSGYGETWFDRAHNTVMDVLSMTGMIGFITFAAVWILLYASVIKARRKGNLDVSSTAVLLGLPAGYFLQNLFVFDHPAAFSMSFLLYGLVIASVFPVFAGKEEETAKVTGKSMPWVSFGIIQLVAIVFVYLTSVMPFYASYLTIKANQAFSAGDADGMLAYAKRAASIQTPYLDEQTFLHSRNLISLADSGQLTLWPKWKEMYDLTVDITERHLASHGMNAHPRFIYANLLQSIARATGDSKLAQAAAEQYKASIAESPKRQQLYFGYGRLLSESGLKDESLDIFKQAAEFDPEIGEGWWYVGLAYWYDLNDQHKGAEYIVKSFKSTYPYPLRGAQDALLVARALDLLNDKDGLKALIDKLPSLPAASSAVYVEIAKTMEHQGLIEERNLILGAVLKMDPKVQSQLQGLMDGRAKTIDESIKLATSTKSAVQKIVPSTATTTTLTSTAAVPTVRGPRAK